jgi:histidyl-tRNA synthetase
MAQNKEILHAPRGTQDILPEEMPLPRFIEDTARQVMEHHGYHEIRTPVFEETGLFARTTGETTDIVEKEMFTIKAGEEGSFALRPEGTPGVVRAYVEHEIYKQRKFVKFYYIYNIFRYERPQAGRLRQFDQIGAEAIGSYDPLLDAETILMAKALFEGIGLGGFVIRLNSFGCEKCRPAYRTALRQAVAGKEDHLCANCRRRLDRNIFRLLDCKEEKCQEIKRGLPSAAHTLPRCARRLRPTKLHISLTTGSCGVWTITQRRSTSLPTPPSALATPFAAVADTMAWWSSWAGLRRAGLDLPSVWCRLCWPLKTPGRRPLRSLISRGRPSFL